MTRLCSQGPPRLLVLAVCLVIVGLAAGACVQPPPQGPAATSAPATGAPAQPPATTAPAGGSVLPVGVDAQGNFYRGDPNAAVKLVEFSDFQ